MESSTPIFISKPPFVSPLIPGKAFDRLTEREKLYAHYMSCASWHGTRIIMRQVSPESNTIFDFILELHRSCAGDWAELAINTGVSIDDLRRFLDYAAVFLGNVGNYFGSGDQKFIPHITEDLLEQISKISKTASELFEQIAGPILAHWPRSLGFPSDVAQSSYYPGDLRLSKEEIKLISEIIEENSILVENTRVCKSIVGDKPIYNILQASTEADENPRIIGSTDIRLIRLTRGDHKEELRRISQCIDEARKYAANATQEAFLSKCRESFESGNLEVYKDSQRLWVKDFQPSVEIILGFVEPYRDPIGIRAEFEGLVAITDKDETKTLTKLVENSDQFIRRLPWALNSQGNSGKGPFEKELFEEPDFTSLHTLAYNSSIIFPGINLPNYNDIRQQVGFKNVMITNTMTTKSPNTIYMSSFFEPSEAATFLKHRDHAYYLWVVFHELLGHGTSKLLIEDLPGVYNFDISSPPINPLTGKPITSWYTPGQTWNRIFSDIATTVDECRAECVGAYLLSDMDILALFGYTDHSEITGRDLEYNMYMILGGSGLRSLENYNVDTRTWGQAHSRAHFAMFKALLSAGNDFLTVQLDSLTNSFTVRVDRTKIATHGKPALSQLLLRLHIYRCTADVSACRKYYEDLTTLDETFLQWRQIILKRQPAKQVYVQPNTVLQDGKVNLKEYEVSVEGVIQSWAERMAALE